MAKPKKVQLTLDSLKKEDQQYDKLTKVVLSDGNYTYVNKKFRPSEIELLIQTFSQFIRDFEQSGGTITNRNFFKFLYLFVVKHFTSIVREYPDTFASQLQLFDMMADNQYIQELEDHFDKEEILKVLNTLMKQIETYIEMVKSKKELKQEILQKIDGLRLEQGDVIKSILFGEDNGN